MVKGLVSHTTKRKIESAIAALMPAGKAAHPVSVLCYHSVDPTLPQSSLGQGGTTFHQHLEWLSEHTDVVHLNQIAEAAKVPNRTKPTVAITFDDGYLDNYTHALPALKEFGFPATFFLTTGLIERNEWVIHHLANLWGAQADDVEAMSWKHVTEMRDAGMAIGAHTHTHQRMVGMSNSEAANEIRTSKVKIENQLGGAVSSLAYPFGKPRQHFSADTVTQVKQAGFTSGVSILYRRVRAEDNPLAIPRFPITNDSVDILRAKVLGKLDMVGWWQERAPDWISRAVSVDVAEPPVPQ